VTQWIDEEPWPEPDLSGTLEIDGTGSVINLFEFFGGKYNGNIPSGTPVYRRGQLVGFTPDALFVNPGNSMKIEVPVVTEGKFGF
jgi:hypothetical protein